MQNSNLKLKYADFDKVRSFIAPPIHEVLRCPGKANFSLQFSVPYRTVPYGTENFPEHESLFLPLQAANVKTPQSQDEAKSITPRQGEVLEAALALLVKQGYRLTMAGVAQKAACSKETLYKWFGDRKGLLRATVKWQAAKVGMPYIDPENLDAVSLKKSIETFGRDLLGVLSGEISVALNRVAIAHAGPENANLGAIVLENGRLAMGRRLKPVLEAGQKAGLLSFADSEEAFRSFFGLLIRDTQIRLLLGDQCAPDIGEIATHAERATEQFYALYGAQRK